MTRIWLLLALCMPLLGVADTRSTKSALSDYFTDEKRGPRLVKSERAISLEICFDICDYYRANSTAAEEDLWDLAFLHQYYLNEALHLEEFRAKYVAIAKETLKVHAKGCQVTTDKHLGLKVTTDKLLARCAVLRLAHQSKVYYAVVRYDEGARCQVPARLTEPTYLGKGSCKRLK